MTSDLARTLPKRPHKMMACLRGGANWISSGGVDDSGFSKWLEMRC